MRTNFRRFKERAMLSLTPCVSGVWGNRSRPLSFSNARKVRQRPAASSRSSPSPPVEERAGERRPSQFSSLFRSSNGARTALSARIQSSGPGRVDKAVRAPLLNLPWLGSWNLKFVWMLVVGIWSFAAALPARAENAVILESFEESTSCATLVTNSGGRPIITPPGVTLSSYTKQNPGDLNVTEGKKSLKIVLSGKKNHSTDFQIRLSEEASAKVRKAAASSDVARY